MTLTSHTDFAAFLEAVQQCRGEVLFCTREGDKLNLKSTLSKYLFAALAGNEELLRKGKSSASFRRTRKNWHTSFPPQCKSEQGIKAAPHNFRLTAFRIM